MTKNQDGLRCRVCGRTKGVVMYRVERKTNGAGQDYPAHPRCMRIWLRVVETAQKEKGER